jgi:hypothetical protein
LSHGLETETRREVRTPARMADSMSDCKTVGI